MYFLFLLNLSHYVKSYGHFCQILAFFTIPTHQIWSCPVTQASKQANFENFPFDPNFTFNIRKNHKISSGKALYFRSYQPKTTPSDQCPVSLRLIRNIKLIKFQGNAHSSFVCSCKIWMLV